MEEALPVPLEVLVVHADAILVDLDPHPALGGAQQSAAHELARLVIAPVEGADDDAASRAVDAREEAREGVLAVRQQVKRCFGRQRRRQARRHWGREHDKPRLAVAEIARNDGALVDARGEENVAHRQEGEHAESGEARETRTHRARLFDEVHVLSTRARDGPRRVYSGEWPTRPISGKRTGSSANGSLSWKGSGPSTPCCARCSTTRRRSSTSSRPRGGSSRRGGRRRPSDR